MEQYDVVIIGTGIGGLVCGCYLVKSGLKVLIIEQHNKPGGYCTSFERGGFKFDVGAHYLVGAKRGSLGKIFKELEGENEIKFNQFNPTDKIIMPENTVYIKTNIDDTVIGFQKVFPDESKNISKFFQFILNKDFLSLYSKIKKMNFKEILDSFFENQKIKSTLEVLLGNIGVSAHKVSAVSAVLLFRELIFDPGWYPSGGIQMLPDTLARMLMARGGDMLLSKRVTKILLQDDIARGVLLDDGTRIEAGAVVSNADITETFKKLLDVKTKESEALDNLEISPSPFSVYLGLKDDFKKIITESPTIWFFSTYKVKECYSDFNETLISREKLLYVVCTFPFMHDDNLPNKPTVELFMAAPFSTSEFWNKNRNLLMEKLIEEAEKVIPNLRKYIELKFNATPQTFYKYTSNRNGAAYGWASASSLITKPIFMGKTSIKNLYLAGHWCNGGLSQGGIPQVATSGRTIARLIIHNAGLKWDYKHNLLL